MKTCTKCGFTGKYESFYKQAINSKDGYQSHCKTCDNARKTAWKKANPQAAKIHSKIADANKYLKNRQVIAKRNLKWKKQNPAKMLAIDAKRRAAMLQRVPNWLTETDIIAIECKYSVCAMLNKFGVQKWHVDHIIPLQGKSVSGLHVPTNLQVITEAANLAKSNIY
jgi:5-methylcytosine-specific restriction endonuclease McrA